MSFIHLQWQLQQASLEVNINVLSLKRLMDGTHSWVLHCWFELGLTSNQHRKVIRRRGPRFKSHSID